MGITTSGLDALVVVEAVGPGRGRGTVAKAGLGGGGEGVTAGELGFCQSSMAAATAAELQRNRSSPRWGGGWQ